MSSNLFPPIETCQLEARPFLSFEMEIATIATNARNNIESIAFFANKVNTEMLDAELERFFPTLPAL